MGTGANSSEFFIFVHLRLEPPPFATSAAIMSEAPRRAVEPRRSRFLVVWWTNCPLPVGLGELGSAAIACPTSLSCSHHPRPSNARGCQR